MLSRLELSQSLTSQFDDLTINQNDFQKFQSPAVNYVNPNEEKPIKAKGQYELPQDDAFGEIEFLEDLTEKTVAPQD